MFVARANGDISDGWGLAPLASAQETRTIDAEAIRLGLPARLLMEQAGAQSAHFLSERFGGLLGTATLLCGAGQNGGDGYVLARHLYERGWRVKTIALALPKPSESRANHQLWLDILAYEALSSAPRAEHYLAEDGAGATLSQVLAGTNLIVDALFGTGLNRPLEGAAAELVTVANASNAGLKVALDLPSGLDGDSGHVLGCAFRADLTLCFGVRKRGLYLGSGPLTSGEVQVLSIGWPTRAFDTAPPYARLLSYGASAQAPELTRAGVFPLAARLSPFKANTHKGSYGHVAVVGGEAGYEGAALLSAKAALRAGAGLCTWVSHQGKVGLRFPELMHDSHSLLGPARATVLAVGPGLGCSTRSEAILHALSEDTRPAVLDADALHQLALTPMPLGPGPRLLTPHPLEAARLLHVSTADVQADRLHAFEALLTQFPGAFIILKGAYPIVGGAGLPPTILDGDEPTLAIAGSGDVLTGLLAGLWAQGLTLPEAGLIGAWTHLMAGRELGLGLKARGVLASELADLLPQLLRQLAQH